MASLISPPTAFSSPPFHSDYCLHSSFCFRSPLLKKPHSLSYSYSSSCSAPFSLSRPPDSTICHCRRDSSLSSNSDDSHWSLPFQQFLMSAAQKLEDFLNSRLNSSKMDMEVRESKSLMESEDKKVDVDNWNWERWQRHFSEVEDQERLILLLKSQLSHAIEKEDYEDAARLKVAIAATATKDVVGSVMSTLKKAIEEERYKDAIFVRDNAGAGLVGWWAGVSDDRNDPYGCIIRISAEHGRYVARCYSPRQLATSTSGVPLFEIFVTLNEKGEYRHQAVYLKRREVSEAGPSIFPKSATASSSMNTINPAAGKTDIFAPAIEEDALDDEDKDDSEFADEFSGFQNLLQDMIPGVRVKVLKVTTPDKVDQDLISRVVEQIIEEDDDEKDIEAELDDTDGEDTEDAIPSESEEEKDDEDLDAGIGDIDMEEQSELAVKVVVSGRLVQKLSGVTSAGDLVRIPAKLEPKGRKSFTFCIKEDLQDSVSKDQVLPKKKAKTQGQRSVEQVMSDLVKFFSRGEKIPVKVLKDLISLTLSQAQNRQPLSGRTSFNRIDLPVYPDPLNGLYIGSRGPYTSEVIQLKRKFGQWQEDSGTEGPSDLHFYEYVEAVKLTGDPDVPAGKVAFRAKVGKRYQLPHKGIIPEEFGVVARYKGQGRLADPGFRNPRWVDGELVILDGKYIKGGPVVGFVYWAPEYQFLVFFNRLRIQE